MESLSWDGNDSRTLQFVVPPVSGMFFNSNKPSWFSFLLQFFKLGLLFRKGLLVDSVYGF